LVVTDAISDTATDATTANIAGSPPGLEIDNITGGVLKVRTNIRNTGSVAVNNITWSITVVDGFLLLGRQTNGSIATLNPGEEQEILSKPIFGFGKTLIQVTVEAPGVSISKEQNATILLIFIVIQ
jgi:hypothetical protein